MVWFSNQFFLHAATRPLCAVSSPQCYLSEDNLNQLREFDHGTSRMPCALGYGEDFRALPSCACTRGHPGCARTCGHLSSKRTCRRFFFLVPAFAVTPYVPALAVTHFIPSLAVTVACLLQLIFLRLYSSGPMEPSPAPPQHIQSSFFFLCFVVHPASARVRYQPVILLVICLESPPCLDRHGGVC